jgi:hypothetical protein
MGGADTDHPSTEGPLASALAGQFGECAAQPSPDPLGNGVPISGGEGESALSNARREGQGSAER